MIQRTIVTTATIGAILTGVIVIEGFTGCYLLL
jgi:hypothetical protein